MVSNGMEIITRYGDKFWVPMAAGSAARSAVVAITNPVEMIRTKLQSERLSYRDIGRAIKEAKAVEGTALPRLRGKLNNQALSFIRP